jgi:hypothetical protein
MSTRGCVAVGTPEKWRGVYNHCDSYPTGLGAELYEHVMRQMLEGKTLAEIGDNILKFDDWRNYLTGSVCAYCGKFEGQPHTILSDIFIASNKGGETAVMGGIFGTATKGYPDPEAKFHSHNDLNEIVEQQITSDNSDPLFIEWVYILDPEANAIHVLTHESCPKTKLKKPLETEPDGSTREYVRKLSGGRYHYGHCVYRHALRATVTFDKKPDWEAIECGETYQHCNHYAYAHFPELKGTPSAYLKTQQYIGREPVADHNYCVAYIINGKFYWKGGSGHSGGFANLGGERNVWYQTLKDKQGDYPVAKHVRDKQVPYQGVIWIFPPTMVSDWTSNPAIRPERWAELQLSLAAKGTL